MADIWVLTADKTGDAAQARSAARATGLAFEERRLTVKPEYRTAKPRVEPSLDCFDLAQSDPLAPPWPSLVITIGRRPSMAALWVKRQSGGAARVALLNAPKGRTGDFDLVVAPGFYRLPDSPNLLRIALPLIAVDPAALAAAREAFAPTIGALPKPLHVLLLGGDTGRAGFDGDFASALVPRMRASLAGGGTIFASTSRRTPEAAALAVERQLAPGDRLHRWRPDDAENPYLGLLAHGDSFTVTGDSLSMLTEIARLAKPLAVAEAPVRSGLMGRMARGLGLSPVRDLSQAVSYLIDNGHAARLGEALPARPSPPPDDAAAVGLRLRQLLAKHD